MAQPPPPLPADNTITNTETTITPYTLFIAFSKMALIGFGGVLPVAYRSLVERLRWVSAAEFAELLAFAQVLPGPTICNLSLMIGYRRAGFLGAFASLSGMIAAPVVIVVSLGLMYRQYGEIPVVNKALIGMAAAAAGLIMATAIKMMITLMKPKLGTQAFWGIALFALLSFIGVGILRWPLIVVIVLLAPIGIVYAYIKGEQK